MTNLPKEKEAVTLKLIENVLMGNKVAAQKELQKLVNFRIATQIQKVGKEKLI